MNAIATETLTQKIESFNFENFYHQATDRDFELALIELANCHSNKKYALLCKKIINFIGRYSENARALFRFELLLHHLILKLPREDCRAIINKLCAETPLTIVS